MKRNYIFLLIFGFIAAGNSNRHSKNPKSNPVNLPGKIAIATCATADTFQIIPQPQVIKSGEGTFLITKGTKIIASRNDEKKAASFLITTFSHAANLRLGISEHEPMSDYVVFKHDSGLKPEHYQLSIQKKRIIITAADYNGFLYGVETIKQLLPPQIFSKTTVSKTSWLVPAVEIEDGPRFAYRGLMLDVSRHFFSIEYIKRVVDHMLEHKLNVLHFHAVDDQGWRIQIKRYPRLTEIGAYRSESQFLPWNQLEMNQPGDYPNYGGFYTHEQLKDLVNYARDRGVQIIPEIEMPGHVTSAVAAYPFLSCTGQPVLVPNGGMPPPFLNILCAGKESTYEFIKNILTEVAAIFPSPYIHVGGDEVTNTHWKQCSFCQEKIKNEKLKDEKGLEAYFMTRVSRIVSGLKKKMIVWNEQIETPKGVIHMIYKNVSEVPVVTNKGYQVIAAPASHTYFDFYQGMHEQEPLAYGGYTFLSTVYQFNPVPGTMNKDQASHVMGGQANLWAEFVPDNHTSEYMLYPRLAALSESLWTLEKLKDWNDFSRRMMIQYKRYAFARLNFARSALNVDYIAKPGDRKSMVIVSLKTEFPCATIRYTLNGTVTRESAIYTHPIVIEKDTEISARTFIDQTPVGKILVKKIQMP